MDALELARWKRYAAKGGIGTCTAVVDCAAETPGDLMFFQDDEITVLMPIEGQEGRYMGYCEGVVGQFTASDVRFHGPLKKVLVRRVTDDDSSRASSSGHSSPRLPPQDSSLPPSEPHSRTTSRTASPSATPKTLSPRHSIRLNTNSASALNSTFPASDSTASTPLSPTNEATEAPVLASRFSSASATETSLPHTPGDITENEQEGADQGVRVERNSVSPERPEAPGMYHSAAGGEVVNALLDKVRYRDTTSTFDHRPLSIRDSVGSSSSRADSPPLIPTALRGSMGEEEPFALEEEAEYGIRDSIASSVTNSPPPRFSKPPTPSRSSSVHHDGSVDEGEPAGIRDSVASSYVQQSGIRDSIASSHYDDDGGIRASIASSDGGFGIGMQFIQGLIGNPAERSVESGDGSEEDVRTGRVTSMMTDESFHLPDWGAVSHLPPQQEEEEPEEPIGASQEIESVSHFRDENPTPSQSQDSPARTDDRTQTEAVPSSPSPTPSHRTRSSTSQGTPLEPAPASLAHSDEQAEEDSAPPQDVENPGSAGSASEQFSPSNEAEFDSNDPPLIPGAQSPALSNFPGSGSEAGGSYYEEDVDIYDNYRYSRFSMMSRKSRKSQVNMSFPDPSSMPAIGDAIGSFPLPPPLNTARPLPGRTDSSDRLVSSPKSVSSFSQSPKRIDFQSSPKRFDFPPQPIQPLVLAPRKQLTLDMNASGLRNNSLGLPQNASSPISPSLPTSRSTQFASSLRQQIEEAERDLDDDQTEETETQTVGAEDSGVPEPLTSAFRTVSDVFSEDLEVDSPKLQQEDASADRPASGGSVKALETDRTSQLRPLSDANPDLGPPSTPNSAPDPDSPPPAEVSPEARPLSNVPEESATRGSDPGTGKERVSAMDLALAQLEGRKSPPVAAQPSQEEHKTRETLSPMDTALAQLEGRKSPAQAPSSEALTPQETAALASQFSIENPSGQFVSPSGRRLTFLPHPGAPKPLQAPTQPAIYANAQPQQQSRPPPSPGGLGAPQRPPLLAVMHMVIACYRNPPPPMGNRPPPPATIHGRCMQNLANSVGPVRIDWFLDNGNGPPPPEEVPRSPAVGIPGSGLPGSSRIPGSPLRSATLDVPPSPGPQRGKTPPPISIPRIPLGGPSTTNLRSPPPSSPLAQPPLSSSLGPPNPNGPGSTLSPNLSSRMPLRNVASTSALRSEVSPSPSSIGPPSPQLTIPPSPVPSTAASEAQQDKDSITSPVSAQTSLANDNESMLSRGNSLRSKISAIGLRSKGGPGSSNPGTPTTAQAHFEFSDEKVQVKDGGAAMEFEIVKPLIPRIAEVKVAGGDVDAGDHASVRSGTTGNEVESNRSQSPVVSTRRPSDTPQIKQPDILPSPTDPESIQAHREREQKWLSVMNSTSAASAKKNKKVRKLVQDGIPNSVRSVVWLYLTNTKSRRMDGLYAQLCSRGRVSASDAIERDADRSFPAHPHLRDPKGPIVTLLQAYLRMVPDIAYEQGLAAMAGTILLQSPEEDAFWTFLALMDNHLRGYFAVNSKQMVVDARLLQKAIETADPALAKKLYTDLRLDPVDIARPWFAALFVNTLPNRYLYRVWDVFIYDGASWLFRVALTLLLASKAYIMSEPSISASDALDYLFRPPSQVLPSDADTFVAACLAVKVKEDELRKLRPKIEASLKPQVGSTSRLIQIKDLRAITTLSR
ncbi:hypothetical protein FRC05_004357 [Tulasnella sp. 425]|nr:hypothetical protein FRC05_004357 [Tulasnella sp. 425]